MQLGKQFYIPVILQRNLLGFSFLLSMFYSSSSNYYSLITLLIASLTFLTS